jgi:rhodanese-related sulfurtransferase
MDHATREVYRGELEDLLETGAVLVDVREPEELARGADPLPGYTHLPLSRLNELPMRIRHSGPIIFYCRSGLLSYQAAEIAAGWTTQPVYYLAGGLVGYADA